MTGNKVFLVSAGREGTDGLPRGQPRAYVEVGDVAALPWWVDVEPGRLGGGNVLPAGWMDGGWKGEMPSEAHLEHVVSAHGRPRHTYLCFLQGIVPWWFRYLRVCVIRRIVGRRTQARAVHKVWWS